MDIALTLTGFVVGVLMGLTGVGGGSLMTPILVLAFGITPSVAVGTDLLYATIAKCAGIWVHNRNRTIRWRIAGLLACGSIPSAILTVFLMKELKSLGVDYEYLITLTLSVALILTSLVLLFKNMLHLKINRRFSSIRDLHRRHRGTITVIVGILIGALVTLSSVGAGALGAAILLFLYPGLPAIVIVGTDLAYGIPLTGIAGLGHLHIGTVDFTLLGALLLGALPGTYLGSHLGPQLPDRVVRPILASILFLIGFRFMF